MPLFERLEVRFRLAVDSDHLEYEEPPVKEKSRSYSLPRFAWDAPW